MDRRSGSRIALPDPAWEYPRPSSTPFQSAWTIVRKQRRLRQGRTRKGGDASWQSLLGPWNGVVKALNEVHASPEQLIVGNALSSPSPQYLVHRVSLVTPKFPVFNVRVVDRLSQDENSFV